MMSNFILYPRVLLGFEILEDKDIVILHLANEICSEGYRVGTLIDNMPHVQLKLSDFYNDNFIDSYAAASCILHEGIAEEVFLTFSDANIVTGVYVRREYYDSYTLEWYSVVTESEVPSDADD